MPIGPSANPEFNKFELWATKKIKIIFFGLAACEELQNKIKNLNFHIKIAHRANNSRG